MNVPLSVTHVIWRLLVKFREKRPALEASVCLKIAANLGLDRIWEQIGNPNVFLDNSSFTKNIPFHGKAEE